MCEPASERPVRDGLQEAGSGGLARPPVVLVTAAMLARLAAAARRAPRHRVHETFHAWSDGYQRMLNVVQPDAYLPPHRHRAPAKGESFVVLNGTIAFFAFDGDGTVRQAVRVGPRHPVRAVDLEAGVWHTFLALEPDTVVFEGKNGPYDPETDKELAPWAPVEGDPAAEAYRARLQAAIESGACARGTGEGEG